MCQKNMYGKITRVIIKHDKKKLSRETHIFALMKNWRFLDSVDDQNAEITKEKIPNLLKKLKKNVKLYHSDGHILKHLHKNVYVHAVIDIDRHP